MRSSLRPEARGRSVALQRVGGRIVGIGHIHEDVVRSAYRRWAPVYDHTFGRVATEGRRQAVHVINRRHGRVLVICQNPRHKQRQG